LLGRLAARWARTPVVVHTLHSLAFHPYQSWAVNRALWMMKLCLARHTDHFISVSDAVRRGALAAGIGRPDQHSTIYSGMEIDQFMDVRVDREAVRRALGIPLDAPVVGKVARLFHLKGHAELLRALPAVVRAVPDLRVLLVGDGILQHAVREQARRLGVLGHLVFTGLVPPERIPALLVAMDVVVHASLREGLARVLPQALAMGRPVIAYDLDGSPEVVLPGVTGHLVRPGDAEGLADALIALLRDPVERERLGANGRRLVGKLFEAERMVEQIDRLYTKLLKAKGLHVPSAA
jgi:glycosyltransferase involved in cell wall biosynthesis